MGEAGALGGETSTVRVGVRDWDILMRVRVQTAEIRDDEYTGI